MENQHKELVNFVINTGLNNDNHYGYYDRNGEWVCYLNCQQCADNDNEDHPGFQNEID